MPHAARLPGPGAVPRRRGGDPSLPEPDARRSRVAIERRRLARRCQQLIALEHRLPAVLTGKDKPAGASEMVEFAELCGILGQPASAASLYAKAFDASPPAQDVRSDHRFRPPALPHRPAAAAETATDSAPRSGRGGGSLPASGFRPRSPSGPGRWKRSARRSRLGCPEVGESVGRSRPGRALGPGRRLTGCRRPSVRNARTARRD